MPIRPEMRDRYPDDWPGISEQIRVIRAGGRCECRGECGSRLHASVVEIDPEAAAWPRCPSVNGDPIPWNPDRNTVLTVAHLNHIPEDCRPENLRAMCNACHLSYDRHLHAETRRQTRAAKTPADPEPVTDPLF